MYLQKILDPLSVKLLSAASGAATAGVSMWGDATPLTAFGVAAALAGSASAVVFKLMNPDEKPPASLLLKGVRNFASFGLGAAFGLFMGQSISDAILGVNQVGGMYLGGLTGYGMIAFFVSAEFRRAVIAFIKRGLGFGGKND